jgi:hypothetical protein
LLSIALATASRYCASDATSACLASRFLPRI